MLLSVTRLSVTLLYVILLNVSLSFQNMALVHNQRINGGIMKGRAPPLARIATENSASQIKPKLIRLIRHILS
jgi:hypothetical protein